MSDDRQGRGISRRHFFFGTLLAGVVPRAGFGSVPSLQTLGFQSPNEKLNIAGIGSGGRAMSVLGGCASENIVALADVDWTRGAEGFKRWETATRYKDFRQMLDKQGKGIDAVAIAIPDHMHATAAIAAMQLGKHVYVEKPLMRTPWEARLLTDAAAKYKVATQMGNQGYSHEATRVAAEIIWSGEIGNVTEVHAFRGRAGWPQGMTTLPAPTKVPDTLDWDLWLGGAPWREFTAGDDAYRQKYNEDQYGFYLPFNWRGFFDFGTSSDRRLGHPHPRSGQLGVAARQPGERRVHQARRRAEPVYLPDRRRRAQVGVRRTRQHAAGDDLLVRHRRRVHVPPGMTPEQARQIPGTGPTIANAAGAGGGGRGRGGAAAAGPGGAPADAAAQAGRGGRGGGRGAGGGQAAQGGAPAPPSIGYNQVFVGSRGYLGTSGRGEGVGLLPGERWADYQLPAQMLTRSPGHQRDWIRACKGGAPACSNFGIAGPYTEWMVLGAVAARFPGEKLLWDPKKLEFTNKKEADKFIKPCIRKGWEIKL